MSFWKDEKAGLEMKMVLTFTDLKLRITDTEI